MYSCVNFKSSSHLCEQSELQSFCKFHTSTELCEHSDQSPQKLLAVLSSILSGSRSPKQLFSQSNIRPPIKRQTSIENLQILINQPLPSVRASLSAFSERFSAFNLDRASSCLSSRFSAFNDEPDTTFKDFDCGSTLLQSDIRQIFSNGDYKIMVAAVVLMCKYLFMTDQPLTDINLFTIFGISAIITFKMSYDQDLPGLMREFSSRLKISLTKLERLEGFFLRAIDYDLNVTGKALSSVMTWFI